MGLGLISEFQYSWDRMSGSIRLIGREAHCIDSECKYRPMAFTYDGNVLRSYAHDSMRGKVATYQYDLEGYLTLRHLLGFPIARAPTRSLVDLLGTQPQLRRLDASNLPDGVIAIEFDYLEGDGGKKESRCILELWIDTMHGFLPRRITTRRYPRGGDWPAVETLVAEVSSYHQMPNGLWMPVAGPKAALRIGSQASERI